MDFAWDLLIDGIAVGRYLELVLLTWLLVIVQVAAQIDCRLISLRNGLGQLDTHAIAWEHSRMHMGASSWLSCRHNRAGTGWVRQDAVVWQSLGFVAGLVLPGLWLAVDDAESVRSLWCWSSRWRKREELCGKYFSRGFLLWNRDWEGM